MNSAWFDLPNAARDGVSGLAYANDALLAASSWDGSLYFYNTNTATLDTKVDTGAPLLDLAWVNEEYIVTGGLQRMVTRVNVPTGTVEHLGAHKAPVKAVVYSASKRAVVSASWDATVKVWDLRSPSMAAPEDASTRAADMTLALPERAFSMSLCSDYIVLVATAGQHLVAYDLRKGDEMLWKRESTVKFQLRCIRAFADGKGYVVSSIDGRCGVEYMEEADGKPFSFKCHRSKTPDGKELITPVNALAFNPVYNTFVTGGGDGTVAAWDHVSKKRLAVLGTFPTSIAALAFNRSGTKLAAAASYTWEEGEKEHPADSIHVHGVGRAMAGSRAA